MGFRLFSVLLLFLCPCLTSWANAYTVEDVVRIALERSPYVKEAVYRLEAKKYSEKKVSSRFFPKITFDYTYTHLKEEPYVKFHYDLDLPLPFTVKIPEKHKVGEHQSVKWGVQATWNLFTGFYLTSLREIERLGVKAEGFRKEMAKVEVAHWARAAYYGVLIAQRNLETAKEAVKQLEAHLKDAESFYKNGLVPYNDVLKAKVALASAIEKRTEAEKALETAWVSFNLLLRNEDVYRRHDLSFKLSFNVDRMLKDKDELYLLAMKNRPDVKAVMASVEAARFKVKAAKSRYYPWVTVFSRYEQSGDNLLANKNDYSNRENFALGVKVDFLIFDWFGRKYDVHRAKSGVLAAQQVLEQLKDRVRLEVQEAYSAVEVALKNIRTAKAALEQAKEDLRITKLQYSQQIVSSSDVIDSEAAYIRAKNNYNNALFSYHVSLSLLARACGLVDLKPLFDLKGE